MSVLVIALWATSCRFDRRNATESVDDGNPLGREECNSDEDWRELGNCLRQCNELNDITKNYCDIFIHDAGALFDCWYSMSYYSTICSAYCQHLPCGSPIEDSGQDENGYQCWLPANPASECGTACKANFYPHEVECEDLYDYGSSEWTECLDPYLEDYCSCWSPCLDLPCSSGKLPCLCLPGGCP